MVIATVELITVVEVVVCRVVEVCICVVDGVGEVGVVFRDKVVVSFVVN